MLPHNEERTTLSAAVSEALKPYFSFSKFRILVTSTLLCIYTFKP